MADASPDADAPTRFSTVAQLREGAKRYRREHPDVPTVREMAEHPERYPAETARLHAALAPLEERRRRTGTILQGIERRKRRARPLLRRLPHEERRRVEAMPCVAGDAYLAARFAQGHAPRPSTSTRRRGSRRSVASSSQASRDGPSDGDEADLDPLAADPEAASDALSHQRGAPVQLRLVERPSRSIRTADRRVIERWIRERLAELDQLRPDTQRRAA